MKFFSLVEQVRPLIGMLSEENEEVAGTTSNLLSSILTPKVYLPVLSIAIPIIASKYTDTSLVPTFVSEGFDKLSKLVDSLTGSKSSSAVVATPMSQNGTIQKDMPVSNLDIKGAVGKQTGMQRLTPAQLNLVGQVPSNGSYTQEEANTIISLKTSGADTSGSKTKMHPKIEELIRAKAVEYGVNQDIAVKIAVVESGGNPNAISSTGAIGVFQFTGATANLMGLSNRFNILDNIDAGIRLLVAGTRFVGSFNSDVATYLALQIGGPNAKYVLTSDRATKISELPARVQKAVRGNLGGKSATVGEYIDANALALETKITSQKSKPVYSSIPTVQEPPARTASPTTAVPSTKVQQPKQAAPEVTSSAVRAASPNKIQATPSAAVLAPTTSVAKESAPTTVKPNYTKPSPVETAKPVSQVASSQGGGNSSPSPTLDGVVRHKSGMYFNTA